MKQRMITRTVWLLSLVSLFTDMASEMLYPVMPLYLREIGFSMVAIGILEGVAEAVAGLSKGYFGAWSDSVGRRMPFVRWGYGLSAVSKPLLALFSNVAWVFFCRTTDRIGKGLRTAPRDALLSDEATAATKASVFGFHRSLDTVGAMLGPAAAVLFLYFFPGEYKSLFIWAFIPGVAAIVVTFIVREKRRAKKASTNRVRFSFAAAFSYISKSNRSYRLLVAPLLVFTLFNSSDVFLLLRMKEAGVSDTALIGVYIFYNAVYAALAYPLGRAADRIGLKTVLVAGLILFAVVYTGFALFNSVAAFVLLFFFYGCYAAATESISKAWISNIVPAAETATAIGSFEGFKNIAAMLASFIAGWLWQVYGAATAFISTAVVTIVVTAVIIIKTRPAKPVV
ncbi:MAG TPA: MFS transporter [Chitinophagaceae bacterium]